MAGSDWFSQYAQQMLQPKTGLPSTAPGRPGNLLQAMGTSGFSPPSNPVQDVQPTLGAPNFLQQLFNQLLGNSQSSYHTPSANEILQEATKTAASQYDPQISAIDRQMSRAKTTAGKNKAELGKLYGAGADAYNQDIKSSKKQGAASVADEKTRQKDLQTKLSGDYASSMNDQMKQFQNLGIQDALPDATKQQRGDLDYLSKLNDTLGNSSMSDLNAENNADINYYNEGKGIMRLTGNEAQSDLMSQLTDYLNSQGDARNSLESQRQAAIATLQNQLTSQAAQQAQTSQQSSWNNLYKLAGLYQQINPQTPQHPATSGLNAASQYLSQYTTPQKAQDTMNALSLLLSRPEIASGQMPDPYNKGKYTKLTPEQAANYGGKYADQNGWAPADKMGLMQALLAYFGRMGS